MSTQNQSKRQQLALAVTRRMLDVPDDASIEELKTGLELIGIDVDAAVQRTTQFVKSYPKQMLDEARRRHEIERQTLERFQQQLNGNGVESIKEQIVKILEQLPSHAIPQARSHYRELTEVTGEDTKSELIDFLWELQKIQASGSK